MSVITKDLGAISAYGLALEAGFEGTEQEYAELLASYGTVAEEAETSAEQAAQAANAAGQILGQTSLARDAAISAKEEAVAAKDLAAQAANVAGRYEAQAQAAKTGAESAQAAAESAKDTAVNVVDGFAAEAQQALDSVNEAGGNWKSLAERQAGNSEAWAVGQRGGVDVGTQDATYHNNAKYYAEQASGEKTDAQTARQGAETAATNASQSAQAAATSASAAAESARTLVIDTTLTQAGQAADAKVVGDKITNLKTDLNNIKAELSTTIDVITTTGHTSSRYRWENDSLAIVSSGMYDITKLVPLEGCSGFSVDYSLTPTAGYGHAPICFFSSTTEVTATCVNHIDTVVADYVYSIPTGAKYVGFMVPTGTHPTVTLYTSKINILEDAVAKLEENNYGCSFPITDLRQTVGIEETFYYNTAVTPNKTTYGLMSVGGDYSTQATKGLTLPNTTAFEAINGFIWRMYNPAFVEIANYLGANGYGGLRHFVIENLSDCSLLAIGDSTVDSDTLTVNLLSHFAEQGHTLTLLGTLGDGSGTNRNEGRSGWKASDYLTNKTYDGATNPFYNPTSQTFDFAYYMTNQGYSAPTFVILQLGINDLSAGASKEDIWTCISTMIDSILSYNSSIKILLNLPTTPNSDQSKMFMTLAVYQNRVVRYNQYAQARAKALYSESRVRCSYCHLILDPDEDIRDGVHPKAAGYAKMALEVINQINCWQNGA